MTSETFQLDEAAIGANASAEGAGDDEGADAATTSGVNICLNHKLQETNFPKKDFKISIQDYMKRCLPPDIFMHSQEFCLPWMPISGSL